MKNNKTCFLITSYCNNEDKLNILVNTINKIKENFNIEILLHSNRVTIDNEIISNVDYFIFDKRYLIDDTKKITCWTAFPISENRVLSMNVIHHGDLGFAVKESINTSLGYLNSLGFENVIIINYDTILDDRLINLIREFTKNKISGILFERKKCYEELNPLVLMLNVKKSLQYFNLSLDEYRKYKTYENFLYSKFANREDVYIMEDWGINDESAKLIDSDSTGILITDFLNIFFYLDSGFLCFVIYNILNHDLINEIEIKIGETKIDFYKNKEYHLNEHKLFRTNLVVEEDQKIIVKINNKNHYFSFQPKRNYLTIVNKD